MKKNEKDFNTSNFEITIPKKGAWQFFLNHFFCSFGIFLTVVSLISFIFLLAIYFVLNQKFTTWFIVTIVIFVFSLCLIIATKILLNFYKKKTINTYINFYKSFEKQNPLVLQNQYQIFVTFDNNKLNIYQDLNLLTSIDLREITSSNYIDVCKEKELKKYLGKRKIHNKSAYLGYKINYNNTSFIIIINLCLTNASLDICYKKKSFEKAYNFSHDALTKLDEIFKQKQPKDKIINKNEEKNKSVNNQNSLKEDKNKLNEKA